MSQVSNASCEATVVAVAVDFVAIDVKQQHENEHPTSMGLVAEDQLLDQHVQETVVEQDAVSGTKESEEHQQRRQNDQVVESLSQCQ